MTKRETGEWCLPEGLDPGPRSCHMRNLSYIEYLPSYLGAQIIKIPRSLRKYLYREMRMEIWPRGASLPAVSLLGFRSMLLTGSARRG